MESSFARLAKLEAKVGACLGCRIRSINDYYRQYVGIEVEGRRLVYINAFDVRFNATPSRQWHPEVMCDGGDAYWGALYDPGTRAFSDLAFNSFS